MPTSLISTGIQFPDNSIQTTAVTGSGGDYVMRSYVSPATWSKPAGLKAVKVTVVGAGGAGGNATMVPVAVTSRGGGGGSGAFAQTYYDAPAIPGPVAVTAGPGTNSFGALISCTAGSNGSNATNTQNSTGGAGGAVTPSPTIQIAINGFAGADGNSPVGGNTNAPIGGGANTYMGLGFGGNPVNPSAATNGNAALGYGAGGSGAFRPNGVPVGTNTGGAGAPGIIIVEEFY